MTFDELDEVLDEDWNEAVDSFEPPENSDEDEDAFQDALRVMVKNLQERAYHRGFSDASESGINLSVRLDVGQSKELVKSMLNDEPITLTLLPFE
jgi:hypothetical protein